MSSPSIKMLRPSLPSTSGQLEALGQSLIRHQGEGKRHRRLVGMHMMGWTSDLMSKHGTHGKGMKERDT